MAYIHEQPDWPTLPWDNDKLVAQLAEVRCQQGRLLGKMETLGFELRSEASLVVLTADVLNSSVIQGQQLNPHEVRSSIACKLEFEVAGLP